MSLHDPAQGSRGQRVEERVSSSNARVYTEGQPRDRRIERALADGGELVLETIVGQGPILVWPDVAFGISLRARQRRRQRDARRSYRLCHARRSLVAAALRSRPAHSRPSASRSASTRARFSTMLADKLADEPEHRPRAGVAPAHSRRAQNGPGPPPHHRGAPCGARTCARPSSPAPITSRAACRPRVGTATPCRRRATRSSPATIGRATPGRRTFSRRSRR